MTPSAKKNRRHFALKGLAALFLAAAVLQPKPSAADPAVERGRYLFAIAGCAGCHTPKKDRETGTIAAGGRALKSPYGTFHTPNITPDAKTGIGTWSGDDFRRALKHGLAPDGTPYFPAFPFTSYTGMADADVADLWAYIKTLPPVRRANRPHALGAPYGWRVAAWVWQTLFFTPASGPPADRGAYLVNVLGHCGECHTPRGHLGTLDQSRHLAGTPDGPHGGTVPNITPDPETGIGRWSDGDLKTLFTLGMLPNTDFVGGGMGEVVDRVTSAWTDTDRRSAIRYLRALPPIRNKLKIKKKNRPPANEWD